MRKGKSDYIINRKEIDNFAKNASGSLISLKSALKQLKAGAKQVDKMITHNNRLYVTLEQNATNRTELDDIKKERVETEKIVNNFVDMVKESIEMLEDMPKLIHFAEEKGIIVNKTPNTIGNYKRNRRIWKARIPKTFNLSGLLFLIDSHDVFLQMIKETVNLAASSNSYGEMADTWNKMQGWENIDKN